MMNFHMRECVAVCEYVCEYLCELAYFAPMKRQASGSLLAVFCSHKANVNYVDDCHGFMAYLFG